MGHYSEFYEAAEERRNRDERASRCRRIVTVEQEIEYHQQNSKLYSMPRRIDGFVREVIPGTMDTHMWRGK